MKANYGFVVNAERNGFEVHFKTYNKAAWNCLIKNYKMLPMAKKGFVYATPKKMTIEEFWKAFESIAKGLEFTDEDYKLYLPQIIEAERNAYGITFHSAKYNKYLQEPEKAPEKPKRTRKAKSSKKAEPEVPMVAEEPKDFAKRDALMAEARELLKKAEALIAEAKAL